MLTDRGVRATTELAEPSRDEPPGNQGQGEAGRQLRVEPAQLGDVDEALEHVAEHGIS